MTNISKNLSSQPKENKNHSIENLLLKDIKIQIPINKSPFVFEGMHSDQKVALRKLPTDNGLETIRKLRPVFNLRHPTITCYYGIHQTPKQEIFLVMEYHNETLANYLSLNSASLHFVDLLLL